MQPVAKIIETNYSKVSVKDIIDTNSFDYETVASSAGWIKSFEEDIEKHDEEEHDEEEHEHEHHHEEEHSHHEHHHEHHHDHDEGEAEEYGISTFVYTSRKPVNEEKFNRFVENMPSNIIRCKGLVWFSNDNEMSYIFEQAGRQMQLSEAGYWVASAPKEELEEMLKQEPDLLEDWDEEVGDRVVKLVFIGRKMDKEGIIQDLNECIE